MIFYGTGVAHLITEESETAECPECKAVGSIVFNIYSNHAHLYWIPLFPTGRKGYVECTECKISIDKKELPHDLLREYKEINSYQKPPFWQFAGVAILVVGLAASGAFDMYNKHQVKGYLENPEIGDIYKIKTDYGYSTMRLALVAEDSLYVMLNNYEIDRKSQLKDIDKASNYNDSLVYGFSRQDIIEMNSTDEIYDVIRK